ncbi:hypothetical protein [Paraburkholderia sediminicola]|uniref:hypothetical protein n=1 Tax=Paraburkholderia sediminicola TaxID=458836 RepID=UPI0038B7DAD5
MTQQSSPLEIYVDDSAGVIFSPRNTKVSFSSTYPAPGKSEPIDREVFTLVMPTDTLLTFCLNVVKGFADNGEALSGAMVENSDLFKTAAAAAEAIASSAAYLAVEEAYTEPAPKRKPRGPKKPAAAKRAVRRLA